MARPTHVCRSCCYAGKPDKIKNGSLKIEILLWCCLIVPGLIYSLWRNATAIKGVCPRCGMRPMISTKGPLGQVMSGG